MTTPTALERSIAAWMADEAAGSDDGALFDHILAATDRARPDPRWLALLKEPPMRFHSRVAVGSPTARLVFVTLIPLMLLLASVAVALAVQPAGETDDWPIGLGDYDRSGVAEQGPAGLPVVKWRFQAGGSANGNVAIVGGFVYASSDDGLLHALSRADGTERWSYPAAGSGVSVAEGTVLIADGSGAFHGLDAQTGIQRWRAEPLPAPTGPTYGAGGFYVGTEAGELVAMDLATGDVHWRAKLSDVQVNNPAFMDGKVFAGTDGAFVAVNAADGAVLWTIPTGDDGTGSARVGAGIAFVGASADTSSSHLRAIDIDSGRELWSTEGLIFTPAIADGVGYSGGQGLVTVYDLQTGTERWRATFNGTVRPTAIADGVVYVPADGERRIYALDAATGRELWRFELDGGVTSIAVAGGVVYSATDAGTVWAIGGDGTDLTPGPIPSFAATTPAPSVSPSSPPTSPGTATLTAEFLWEASGPEEPFVPTNIIVAPDGKLWVTDPLNDRFAIFTTDGEFVEYWGESGSDDGEFEFQRFNGDWYGGVGFAPDGSFFTMDAGNRRVQHFDKDRKFLAKWGSFGSDPGEFNLPTGIAVAPDGTVHVLDEGRGVIERYDADGTVLGTVNPFQDHRSGFNTAGSMSVDDDGNVYVSMIEPNQVVRLDPAGEITQVFEGPFVEQAGYPSADAEGRLFVSQGPSRGDAPGVLVFDPDGTYVGGWAPRGDGEGELGFPTGVLVDDDGNVYVGDAAGNPMFPGRPRIQKFHVDFDP